MIKVINIVTGTIIAQYERQVVKPLFEVYPYMKQKPDEHPAEWERRIAPGRDSHAKYEAKALDHNEAVDKAAHMTASRLNGFLEATSGTREVVKMYMVVDTSELDCLGIVNVEISN